MGGDDSNGDVDITKLKLRSVEIKGDHLKSIDVADGLKEPLEIEVINEYIVIIDPHTIITVVDLENPSNMFSPFNRGKGPNEFGFIVDVKYSELDSIVYFFDGVNMNLFSYHTNLFFNKGSKVDPLKVGQIKGALKIAILNDSTIVSTGWGKGRFQLHDINYGKKLLELGVRPKERYFAPSSEAGADLLNNQANIYFSESDSSLYLSYTKKPLIEGYKVVRRNDGDIDIIHSWSVDFINKNLDKYWNEISNANFDKSQLVGNELYSLYNDAQNNYLLIAINSAGEITHSYNIDFDREIKSFSFDNDGRILYILAETEDLNTDIFTIEMDSF